MRIALVHDWLNQMGGAEGVLENLVALFPSAPLYTSIYRPEVMPDRYRQWDIRTSWMDKLPLVKRHHQWFLPLYPLAFEALDLSGYDVV
ncbi:MAG TPA: glycosyltransferase family 4 protein, partial [Anaerolineae bacterium]|nr:glycosyltransferase family 4 protein [Anaerolineae bacterium]